MFKTRIAFAIILLLLTGGCKEKTEAETFDVNLFLKDITQKVIIPTLEDFKTQTQLLSAKIEEYTEAPEISKLDAIKTQWVNTAMAYERTYVFHFGPAKSKFLHQSIYNWPTVPETIEDMLESEQFDAEMIVKASPQIKSLAALEYLLFAKDSETVQTEMATNANRLAYLGYAASFLTSQAERLLKIWQDEGGQYAQKFVSNQAKGINNSFNLLFNGLYNAANTAKVTKIGKPGGFEKSPRTNPDRVQAPYSNTSLPLTLASIEVIEQVFLGKEHPNISQYIASLGADETTNQRIQTALGEIKESIAGISVPLKEAVDSHPEKVKKLYEDITALNIWMGVDARSTLSIILTSTDYDGD